MNKKHFACSLLALLPAFSVFAADFESDGIYYNITGSHTVSVVKGDYDYDGDVTIPAYVANGTHTYTVTAIAENAFQAMNIETVTLPEGLTSIGNQAFYQSSIKTISLPSTLSSMGISAFRECKNLTGVVLPDALKEIKEYAFAKCSNLKTVSLGKNTVKIEHGAFGCTALEELVLPSTMKEIDYLAFYSCQQLKTVKIENAAVYIEHLAFMSCTCLENLDLGNAVTGFGATSDSQFQLNDNVFSWVRFDDGGGAFSHCSALTKVVIPASVTKLEKTFYSCSRLYDVTLPSTLTTIGAGTFEGCPIREITIPNNVTTIGNNAFRKCPLISIDFPSALNSIGNSAFQECPLTDIILPSSLESIGNSAFRECTLTAVKLSSSLKTIGEYAFYGCSLTEITIPKSVTLINSFAFNGCKSLRKIKIDNAPVTINAAFQNCTSLEDLDLGNALVSLGSNSYGCFSGCTSLTKIVIPNTITCLPQGTFQNCTGLNSVIIPNNIQTIEHNAFDGCSSITEILIPESVTSLGASAFQNCTSLESVFFDNAVLDIQEGTFAGCTKLKNVDLGKVTSIGKHAFQNCTQLEKIVIPNSVESLFSSFTGCSSLKEVVIGTGVKEMKNTYYDYHGVFQDCIKLTSVTFKTNIVTSFSSNTFKNCRNLKKIEIPASVTSVGESCFDGCSELSHIYMNATTPPTIKANTFSDYNTPTLHVPSSAKTAYTKADNWKLFTNVIAIGQEPKATAEEIAALETLLAQTQSLYNAAVEGTEPGNYRTGAKAALKAVINEVSARIAATMLTEDVEDGTELLNTATRSFKNKQIKNEYQTDNTLAFATSLKASRGAEFHLPIEMNNANEISAVQFDLYLPEGMTLSTDEYNDYVIELSDRTTTHRHSVSSRQMSDGALRVVVSSTQNATFTGNSGTLLTLSLFPQSTMEADDYDVELKNIVLTDPQATRYAAVDMKSVITVSAYTMGDVNNDAHIDVADLTGVVHFILEDADASLVFNAADMDGNGVVEVNDYAALVNVILDQGTASAAPIRKLTLLKKSQAGTGSAIALSDIELDDNGEGELLVQLTNDNESYTGMQFDLYLPEGMTLADDIETTSRQHGVWAKEQANGCYRVLCSSMTNAELRIGTVMRLAVKATNSIDNEAEVCASDIVLSDVNAQRHENANILSKVYESNEALGITTTGQDATQTTAIDLFGRRANAAKGDILVVDGKKIVR
ncbi:MAG: leucine-rich repeat protein [Bacteroidales bacterium]|nr:leucine-rich repeat protein [Bacteroidales bacterium]